MNQSGSYSVAKKGQGNGDNQYYLLAETSKNAPLIVPKSIISTEGDDADVVPFLNKGQTEGEPGNMENFPRKSPASLNYMDENTPVDKFQLIYFLCLLHGIGVLMPWNMFINANSYFVDYKLSKDYTGVDSNYSLYFLQFVGFAAQIPNLIFNWINVFIQLGGSLTIRIVWSIVIEVIMFVLTIILAMVDSSSWPAIFFWITMVIVIIINIASGIYQNTIFGLAATLPFRYSGGLILGSNISGTFVSILNIISIAAAPGLRTAAIYYFIVALVILLICFDTFFALPFNKFYRYHTYEGQKKEELQKNSEKGKTPYILIFKKSFSQLFNTFMIFFVTLSLFPAITAGVRASSSNFFISEKYYTSVLCFLSFNLSAMIGSLIANWIRWPSPKYLVVPVLCRLVFIPLIILCNFQPVNATRTIPVLIENDYLYWTLSLLLGITSGYLSSLSMMYVSKSVPPEHARTAGMFGSATLITGIFMGILFSMLLTMFLSSKKSV